ncbi:MAG: TetR/AcrR family transcriptional regulator, partial [Alphaproteobacteria bacterium]
MRNIAARIGISPTAIYLYFQDKHTLLHALGEQLMERLFPLFVSKWQSEQDPALKLRFVLDTFVEYGLANPAEYRLLFMSTECSIGQPGHRPAPGDPLDETDKGMQTFALLQQAIGEMIAQGRYRDGDPAIMAELMWASCHGLITLLITHPHFPWSPRKALVEGMHKLLLSGFAAEPAAQSTAPVARRKSTVKR